MRNRCLGLIVAATGAMATSNWTQPGDASLPGVVAESLAESMRGKNASNPMAAAVAQPSRRGCGIVMTVVSFAQPRLDPRKSKPVMSDMLRTTLAAVRRLRRAVKRSADDLPEACAGQVDFAVAADSRARAAMPEVADPWPTDIVTIPIIDDETELERSTPRFNAIFGGPAMGLKQLLGWALAPYELVLAVDSDVVACPTGIPSLFRELESLDLAYGRPMFPMAKSGNYRLGYGLLPQVRDRDRGPANQTGCRAAPEDHPFFECLSEPNTGVVAFNATTLAVRHVLVLAYDAYRRHALAARALPDRVFGGTATQYSFREAIFASLVDARADLVPRLRFGPMGTICRAWHCAQMRCNKPCFLIHSRAVLRSTSRTSKCPKHGAVL